MPAATGSSSDAIPNSPSVRFSSAHPYASAAGLNNGGTSAASIPIPFTRPMSQPAEMPPPSSYPTAGAMGPPQSTSEGLLSNSGARGSSILSGNSDHQETFESLSAGMRQLFRTLEAQSSDSTERVENLRRELGLWRDSYMRSEKEKAGLEERMIGLSKQVANLEEERNGRKERTEGPTFSAVLIDGDGLIFDEKLLKKGTEGGKNAASRLRLAVQELGDALLPEQPTTVLVNVFMHKTGLATVLSKIKGISPGTFDEFVTGFNQAHELFSIVDVGMGKEASDAKVREHLRLYTRLDNCKLVLFGGSHDNGYKSSLSSLATDGLLRKVQILRGYAQLANELKAFEDKVVDIPGLFMSQKLEFTKHHHEWKEVPHIKHAHTSAQLDKAATPSAPINGGKEQLVPASVTLSSKVAAVPTASADKKKVALEQPQSIDVSSQKLKDLRPRPCHAFYLSPTGCRDGEECQYSHAYILTNHQRAELRKLAKQVPCPFFLKGRCNFGDECLYGHACPHGSACPFGKSCRFAEMGH